MAIRRFADSTGIPWQVWDVKPECTERRRGGDRRVNLADVADVADSEARFAERRRSADRRSGLADSVERLRLRPEFEDGWLCFESRGERRRLAPPPKDWHTVSDGVLEVLCRQAEPSLYGERAVEQRPRARPSARELSS